MTVPLKKNYEKREIIRTCTCNTKYGKNIWMQVT